MIADVFASTFASLRIDLSHPRDPALAAAFGLGDRTKSGIDVTATKALGYPAVYRAVNIISNGVAKPKPIIYKRLPKGGKERATKHPAYRLITRRPNPWMTASEFRKTLQAHVLLWGNGLAYIDRGERGEPIEYLPLLPDRSGMVIMGSQVTPDKPLEGDADLMYYTMVGNGEVRLMLPENILHIRGLSFNGVWGFSVIELLKESIGLGLAAREFGARFFGHGAMQSGIVYMPPGLDEEAKEVFVGDIRQASEGLGRAHRLMVVEEGTKFEPLTMPLDNAQFLNTREFEIREIAAIVGCQPHKLGDPSRKSYNSLEQSNQEHLDDDLDPWLGAWEDALGETSLTESEKENDTHFIEFNRNALLRTNLAARTAHYASGRNWGYLSANDIRRKENEDPIGPEGDIYLIPTNMTPANRIDDVIDAQIEPVQPAAQVPVESEEDVPEENGGGDDNEPAAILESFHQLAIRECERMVGRVCRQAVKKAGEGGSEFLKFLDWIDDQCQEPQIIRKELRTLGQILRNEFDRYTQPPYTADALASNVRNDIETIESFACTQAANSFKEPSQ